MEWNGPDAPLGGSHTGKKRGIRRASPGHYRERERENSNRELNRAFIGDQLMQIKSQVRSIVFAVLWVAMVDGETANHTVRFCKSIHDMKSFSHAISRKVRMFVEG